MDAKPYAQSDSETRKFVTALKQYRHTPFKLEDGQRTYIHPSKYNAVEFQKYRKSHGGDVLEHSQWTELQIRTWIRDNNALYTAIKNKAEYEHIVIAAAFLHDIGKGGDCIKSCMENVDGQRDCFYDTLSNDKYQNQSVQRMEAIHVGDRVHPQYSTAVMTGQIPFYLTCEDDIEQRKKLNIDKILHELGVWQWRPAVFVIIDMHWEFGVINVNPSEDKYVLRQKYWDYIKKFVDSCERVGSIINKTIKPTADLLAACILVACADISAGVNERLVKESHPESFVPDDVFDKDGKPVYPRPMTEVYADTLDPWKRFKMEDRALEYQQGVLGLFAEICQQ